MTSIDRQKWRLLQSKAKVVDEIAKIKPTINGEIKTSAPSLLEWYERDPEAFFGAVIQAMEGLYNADNRQLAGMRRRYRTFKWRRSPGSGKTQTTRKRRSDRDGAAPEASENGGSVPNNEMSDDDFL